MRSKRSQRTKGALGASALFAALAVAPAFAANSDPICNRHSLPTAPTDLGLRFELVDIDIVNLEAQPDIIDAYDIDIPIEPRRSAESPVIRRDLITRDRATTILREIFDEPNDRPELSLVPGSEPIADPARPSATAEGRAPQPEVTDNEPESLSSPIDISGKPLLDDARPVIRDDESLPYREQMFRTDI